MSSKLILTKKPKGVTILEGFPGIGLIGTITTEYLSEHLEMEKIGQVIVDDVPALIAVHNGKIIEPISIHYNKKHNIVLIHAISMGKGIGWELAEVVQQLAAQLQAKEIISVEGVGSQTMSKKSGIYYISTTNGKKKAILDSISQPLKEGIVVGVTGALLARPDRLKTPITAFFAETASNLPDSKAAAAIIKVLDEYLGLEVDPKPLLKQAEEFESKLQSLMDQTKDVTELQKKKTLSYVG